MPWRKEPEKMFEWLEHAWTTHDAGATELLVNPFLAPIKDDLRFIPSRKRSASCRKPLRSHE